MPRALSLIVVALLLAGCATSPSYRYYGERSYSDGYAERVVEYAPTHHTGSWNAPVWYDYPAYYSIFWSLNRSYVDPYWYPHFYYGVTWFPRNYYSVLYRSWHGPSWYGGRYAHPWHFHLAYSPYRYSWVDHYYDWYPWYATYPHYSRYYKPRYGNARNEAERLSRYSEAFRGDGLPASEMRRMSGFSRAARSQALVDTRREYWRGADYSGVGARGRIDPDVSGFRQGGSRAGQPTRAPGGAAARQDPQVSGFRGPDYGGRESSRPLPARSAPGSARRWNDEGVAYPYSESSGDARRLPSSAGRTPAARESAAGIRLPSSPAASTRGSSDRPRLSGEPAIETPARRSATSDPRSPVSAPPARPDYQAPRARAVQAPAATPRHPSREASAAPAPAYRAPPAPRYQAPQSRSAPAPRYEAPPQRSAPAPRYEAPPPRSAPAPRYEAPAAPRSEPAARERPAPVQRGESRSEPRGSRRAVREED